MIDSMYKLLAKLGFTDPLHPAVVHIPIGLVIGAFVFFLVALIFKRKQLVLTARHASILALIFVLPSILFGVLDWIHFYRAALIPAIQIKIGLAAALIVLLSVGIAFGGAATSRNVIMVVIYLLSTTSVVALGWFGAGLIYTRGSTASAAGRQAAPSAPAAPAPAAPETPVAQKAALAGFAAGKAIFENFCSGCHPGGQNIVYPKLPIKGSKRLASLAAFEAFVRNPKMPDGSAGGMPPFGKDLLTDAQAKDLYSYVSSAFK